MTKTTNKNLKMNNYGNILLFILTSADACIVHSNTCKPQQKSVCETQS